MAHRNVEWKRFLGGSRLGRIIRTSSYLVAFCANEVVCARSKRCRWLAGMWTGEAVVSGVVRLRT